MQQEEHSINEIHFFHRFTPEQLGVIASTATVWMIIEILALLLSMYILQVTTDLKYLDLLAYCGYKYVGYVTRWTPWSVTVVNQLCLNLLFCL